VSSRFFFNSIFDQATSSNQELRLLEVALSKVELKTDLLYSRYLVCFCMQTLFCSSITHHTPTAAAAVPRIIHTARTTPHLRAPHTPVQLLHTQTEAVAAYKPALARPSARNSH
ncbi:unnamed protein product, partial [Laminaria digitata]